MIRVRALGACEIQVGRKRITLTTEVPFALAFYLTQRAGEVVTRDELAEAFWGSADPTKARHSLRQTLYKLRAKGLPLDEGAEELCLDPVLVESDARRVLEREWPAQATPEEVDAALEVLPGFSRRMAAGFTEWLDALRAQVAAAHRRAALAQITRARREARWADLERWARQVLRSDPLNEEATLARAESAAMGGSKAAALEILDEYMAELGDNAPRIGLPASILRRRIAERQPEWVSRGPREVPLVGRTELMNRLTGFVEEAAAGRGGGVMLWGAPGVGKTRLALELRTFSDLRGFRTIILRPDASHSARPLATLLGLIPLVLDLPGAAGCAPSNLAVARRLLRPDLESDLLTPVAPGADAQAGILAALSDLIRSVAEETRTLVILDDAHNVDSSSVSLLNSLILATADTRMLWVVTSRGNDPRWSTRSVVPALRQLNVPALSEPDAIALASALAQVPSPRGPRRDPAAVARAAGGNPLFVRELSSHHPTEPHSVPRSLRELIQDRLSHLGVEDIRLLRTVTLLGQLATVARVVRALDVTPRVVSDALEHLESEGILRLGSLQTLELHECWSSVVSESLSATVRATLSLDIAVLLETEQGVESEIHRDWHAAELFAAAGERDRARRLFARCGERMIRVGMSGDTVPVLERALALAIESHDRVEILMQLARAHYFAGRLEECVAVSRSAQEEDRAHTPRTALASTIIQSLLVDSLTKLRLDHRSELAVLARLATDSTVPKSARLFACLFGIRVVFNDARSPLEDVFRNTAREISETEGPTLIGGLVELVWVTERGTASEILSVVRAVGTIPTQEEPLKVLSMSARYQAIALRWTGDFAGAVERAEQAYSMSMRAGLHDEGGLAAELLSFIYLDLEDFISAERWIDQWQSVESRVAYPARTHALVSARARLFVQRGNHAAALELYRYRLADVSHDLFAKRKVADLSTILYAATCLGESVLAEESLRVVESVFATEPPAAFLDVPAELTIRSLILSDRRAKAAALGKSYVQARINRLPEGLPPVCSELRAIASAPPAASDDPSTVVR